MILLREARDSDVETLEQLADIPGFISLPRDPDVIRAKIARSAESFSGKVKSKGDAKYIFVAEDLATKRVVGTSQIAGQHGTPDSPHFYFQVSNERKFSETINTGFIHGTLELKWDTDGPSELGGLVVDPKIRNSEERVGRQISFVRFLYMGMNPDRFKKKAIAELLPPLNKKGQSPLWEAIGRRFTNMDYWEADELCQKNKEFIDSLFPSGKIYTTFFSAEARNAIGKVNKQTEPVLHMLKKIGFKYVNQVDPFDGGPHLWADVAEIAPIQGSMPVRYQGVLPSGAPEDAVSGLLARVDQPRGQFRALAIEGVVQPDKTFRATLSDRAEAIGHQLGLSAGSEAVFMPFY